MKSLFTLFALGALVACSESPTEPDSSSVAASSATSSTALSATGTSDVVASSAITNPTSQTGASSEVVVSSKGVSSVALSSKDVSSVVQANSSSVLLSSSSAASSSVALSSSQATHVMKLIPAGTFNYGKIVDSWLDTPTPGVSTTLDAFYMDSTEVTQKEYEALMGVNYSRTKCENCSVTYMTFYEMLLFANARSKRDGLDTTYSYSALSKSGPRITGVTDLVRNVVKNGYRVPSAQEFEYALRAGTDTDYFFGAVSDTAKGHEYIVLDEDGGSAKFDPIEVATKKANAWGLYDMNGNANEKTWSTETGVSGAYVKGGGIFNPYPSLFYSAVYASITSNGASYTQGFRLVRNSP